MSPRKQFFLNFYFHQDNIMPLTSEIVLQSVKVLQTETNLGFEPDEEMCGNKKETNVNIISLLFSYSLRDFI